MAVLLPVFIACLFAANWQQQGILNVQNSPHAKLHSVPVHAVTMRAGFWKTRMEVNEEKSIPTMLALLEEHGAVDNFRRLSGRKNVPRRGPLYTDSDVYKWIEAAAWVLETHDDPKLRASIDSLVDDIVAAQEPSGYLNTYWVEGRRKDQFQQMQRGHELYCLGHLLQGAIAYYRATGNRRLLDSGIKFVNYLIRDFGPGKKPLLTGHPELEMALVELYRTEGDRRYLDLAGYLLSGVEAERLNLKPSETKYMFSGLPFTSRTQLEGHAVRAMYACSGAADYYIETGNAAYWKTLHTLWEDAVLRKMYVTGGVGSRSAGESFGEAYELPNQQAYTESCAAIANLFFNDRMLAATADAKFADVMERALYNGINSGVSLNGTLYCYRNPLASTGEQIRNPWYDTTCCPPNIQRVFASLPGYFYSTSRDGLYVHFYDNNQMQWKLESGTPIKLTQTTGLPWKGQLDIQVDPAHAEEFTLFLRIPYWSASTSVAVNGKPAGAQARPGEYLAVKRRWQPGDRVAVQFDMSVRRVTSNPRVAEDSGKVAIQRGPFLYCAEQPDQAVPVADVLLTDAPLVAEWRAELLGGVTVLKQKGRAYAQPSAAMPLYEFGAASRGLRPADITLIPYYAWANREPAPMQVWLPVLAR